MESPSNAARPEHSWKYGIITARARKCVRVRDAGKTGDDDRAGLFADIGKYDFEGGKKKKEIRNRNDLDGGGGGGGNGTTVVSSVLTLNIHRIILLLLLSYI